MSFVIVTDGTANLPGELLGNIKLLPCNYMIDDQPGVYEGDIDNFDGHAYYDSLRNGRRVTTSLLNTQTFIDGLTPLLEQGEDAIYIAMASGISGTYQAAMIAAEELMETFPDRLVRIIDGMGCGFGSGLIAIQGEEYRKQGLSCKEAADLLEELVPHMCQYFTVDDLGFLKRTGRVSAATAAIGTMLNVKPILFGASDGYIQNCAKVRGRKKAIDALVQYYREKAVNPSEHIVAISHGDCLEEAELLAEKIVSIATPKKLIVSMHEPFSGAHVGPGMLGLFFYGRER